MTSKNVKQVVDLIVNRAIQVKPYYDLRTKLEEKYEDAELFLGWTAFINKKGNLAHVMRNGREALLIRLSKLKLKDTSEDYMNKIISKRLYEDLI